MVLQIFSNPLFSWTLLSHSEEILKSCFSAILNYSETEKHTDYFPFSSLGLLVHKDLEALSSFKKGTANYTKEMLAAVW